MAAGRQKARKRITQAERAPKGPLRCLDKVAYYTRAEADVAAQRTPGGVRAYRCHACRWWHTTSQERR